MAERSLQLYQNWPTVLFLIWQLICRLCWKFKNKKTLFYEIIKWNKSRKSKKTRTIRASAWLLQTWPNNISKWENLIVWNAGNRVKNRRRTNISGKKWIEIYHATMVFGNQIITTFFEPLSATVISYNFVPDTFQPLLTIQRPQDNLWNYTEGKKFWL